MPELARNEDSATDSLPLTSLCIVADKTKCPKGFSPITKASDDASDADLWKESSFSFFSRPVRYLAVCRSVPESAAQGSFSVITDITVVKDSDPVPHGYVAIDYTVDSREKALRKRFVCIKTEPRESVVDAVGEVAVLNKTKKTPKGFTSAGEVDGALIVFKVVIIPTNFGLSHSSSTSKLPSTTIPNPGQPSDIGFSMYPQLGGGGSTPANLNQAGRNTVNAFTIKAPISTTPTGVDDMPFALHPTLRDFNSDSTQAQLPLLSFDVRRLETDEFNYNFSTERAVLN